MICSVSFVLVPSVLVVDVLSIVLALRVHVVFVVSASIFATLDNSVHQLQLVSWVAIRELGVADTLGRKHEFDCLRIHADTSQNVFARNELSKKIASLVE